MGKHQLRPHPAFPPVSIRSVDVEISLTGENEAALRFLVNGTGLALPRPTLSGRADRLWETTCFELFLRRAESAPYIEFNFSPSMKWAAYAFESHREGRRDLPLRTEPELRLELEPLPGMACALDAEIDLSGIAQLALRIGLSAIIEETDGTRSYWALAHPPGDEPDFHDPACFALELPAASDV